MGYLSLFMDINKIPTNEAQPAQKGLARSPKNLQKIVKSGSNVILQQQTKLGIIT